VSDKQLADKVEAISQLLRLFRFERGVYLGVTICSLLILLGTAIYLISSGGAVTAEITGLFGSAGAITYTTGRLLRMWSEALRVLAPEAKQESQ
jgi:1,4-dihydroxy-2-naphthoate octaprenyltransferase